MSIVDIVIRRALAGLDVQTTLAERLAAGVELSQAPLWQAERQALGQDPDDAGLPPGCPRPLL